MDVDESKIITFEEGIPGFFHCKQFVLLEEDSGDDENQGLIWWLQSLDEGDVAFVLINVFALMPDYNPTINPDDIADLGEYAAENFVVYNIAVVPDNASKMRVNLKAPLVINTLQRKGKQVVATNDEYNIRYEIFEELKKRK